MLENTVLPYTLHPKVVGKNQNEGKMLNKPKALNIWHKHSIRIEFLVLNVFQDLQPIVFKLPIAREAGSPRGSS